MSSRLETVRREWDILLGAGVFLLCVGYILWDALLLWR